MWTADEGLTTAPGKNGTVGSDIERDEVEELLADWKENSTGARFSKLANWPSKRSHPRQYLVVAALLASLIIIIVVRTSLTISGVKAENSTIKSNDYVLDPNWNAQTLPSRREYWFTVRDHTFNPDGVFRPMILVNNQFPGPLVEANEGDTIVVHVKNQAVNATSIHWHGIYQKGTPHMDGTVGISQCPIGPGKMFTYEFTVLGQSGTYWWHAHYGVQSSDGLHGPLIIHGRNEDKLQRLPYTTDRVVLLSDHYHELSSSLLWQYLKPDMENAEPVPDNGLVNGKSVVDCDQYPSRKCDNISSHVGHYTLNLSPKERHRLRLINVGAFAEFQLQIDEHKLAVTEVDGTDVEPKSYHRVDIAPAQRYSVVVETNSTTGRTFWLRARMITTCFTNPPKNLQSEVRAIVRYGGGKANMSKEVPRSMDWDQRLGVDCRDMNSSNLVPVERVAAPAHVDALFYLRSNFEIGAYRLSRGFFNTSSWTPSIRSPSLIRAVDALSSGNVSFQPSSLRKSTRGDSFAFVNDVAFESSRELVIQTTRTQTIDILISNFDDGNHPLHLHGYKYFVLAQGQGYPPLTHVGADINSETLKPLYDKLDLSNPLRRDTASVEAFGWILLRLIADNPGAWAFHCHLSWHSEAGLLMQFLTRSEKLAGLNIPAENLRLCSADGLEKGLGPSDQAYHDLAK